MPTDLEVLDTLYPLPAEELSRQWVLTRESNIIPEEWERQKVNEWHLGFHPAAHVCMLRAGDGTAIGWVVEPLVYLHGADGIIPEKELILPVSAHAGAAEIERALYGRDARGRSSGDGLVGEWVAILLAGSEDAPLRRVYLSATHSVVYHAHTQTVATTHNLIPDFRRNEALSKLVNPLSTNKYYPFGLTPFVGIRRLLPNHYLDLDSFTPVRHWPHDELKPHIDGEQGAARMVEYCRRFLNVLAASYDTFKVPLSAGHDSRAVLALLPPLIDAGKVNVILYTSSGNSLGSRVDVQAARQLASVTGLPHIVGHQRKEKPGKVDRLRAFARIGEGKAGSILLSSAPKKKKKITKERQFVLAGMGGEIGRAVCWRDHRYSADEITPRQLTKILSLPVIDSVVDAGKAWLHGLPPAIRASASSLLDLAFVEQRLGCWDAPAKYLFSSGTRRSGPRGSYSPMYATFNVETMLRLPEHYRAAGVLQRDIVAYGWPDLLDVPFNTPTGMLRIQAWRQRMLRYGNRARVHLGALRRRLLGTSEHQ